MEAFLALLGVMLGGILIKIVELRIHRKSDRLLREKQAKARMTQFTIPSNLKAEDREWLVDALEDVEIPVPSVLNPPRNTYITVPVDTEIRASEAPIVKGHSEDRAAKIKAGMDYLIDVRKKMESLPETKAKWAINMANNPPVPVTPQSSKWGGRFTAVQRAHTIDDGLRVYGCRIVDYDPVINAYTGIDWYGNYRKIPATMVDDAIGREASYGVLKRYDGKRWVPVPPVYDGAGNLVIH